MKKLSNRLKKLQNILRDDFTLIFEFEVLTNRIWKKVESKKEMINRTETRCVELANSVVYKKALRLFEYAKVEKGIKQKVINFKRHWANRTAITPTGSDFLRTDMDDRIRDKTNQYTRNKKTAISNMPNSTELSDLLRYEPKVQAKIIPKYE